MVRRSHEIIYPAWLYEHKREIFYCEFSCLGHGPYVRCSNLANCIYTYTRALLKTRNCYHHHGINVEPNVNQRKVRLQRRREQNRPCRQLLLAQQHEEPLKGDRDRLATHWECTTIEAVAMWLSCQTTVAINYRHRVTIDTTWRGHRAGIRQLWLSCHGLLGSVSMVSVTI